LVQDDGHVNSSPGDVQIKSRMFNSFTTDDNNKQSEC